MRIHSGSVSSCPRAETGAAWRATARKIEDLGYSTLFIPDHFEDQFGPLVALTVAAEATTTLRVGLPGLRERLPAPGGAGQGGGHPRPVLRGAGGVRPGGRLDDQRLRAVGHRGRLGRGPDLPHGREPGRHEVPVVGRRGHLCGRALPDRPGPSGTPTRSSDPIRRSSSAAGAGGSSASPPGRPTSSGSTRAWPPATSAPRSWRPPRPSTTTSGSSGSGRRRATGSTISSCSASPSSSRSCPTARRPWPGWPPCCR